MTPTDTRALLVEIQSTAQGIIWCAERASEAINDKDHRVLMTSINAAQGIAMCAERAIRAMHDKDHRVLMSSVNAAQGSVPALRRRLDRCADAVGRMNLEELLALSIEAANGKR